MKTFSFFIACLLSFACTIINTSCQKEYSYEDGAIAGGGGFNAVYTMEGSGGNCSSLIINGFYIEGIALLPSNNIQLRVNVTTIGAYTLSTSLVNGIRFSTSGNFTDTGSQTITLTGSGTPLSTGIFTYTTSVGTDCTFLITTITGLPATFTLGGSSGVCSNIKVNGTYTSGMVLTGGNTVEVMVDVVLIGSYSIGTNTIEGISFSGSGNFSVPGIQKVILTGSGTPSAPNLLSFTINTSISGCTFDLTVLTPGPQATYALESNPDHTCTGYSVSGTCYSGTPLTSTNTMVVTVTVTVPGNFTISTNTVNGMTFAHTGNFMTPGAQVVVLTGRGTPVGPGTFGVSPQIIGPPPIGGGTCTTYISVM